MSSSNIFQDYDLLRVFQETQESASLPGAENFILEFGPHAANVALNVGTADLKNILSERVTASRRSQTPTRWINFWTPGNQRESVQVLGKYYGFSPRLTRLLCTAPPIISDKLAAEDPSETKRSASSNTVDIELGQRHQLHSADESRREHNFFDIARSFTSYQSIDIGEKFLCIGANWMQPVPGPSKSQLTRIWCWFVLCNDGTVISFHEDPGGVDTQHLKAIRGHFLRVLGQISEIGRKRVEGIEVLALRLPHDPMSMQQPSGAESASNLFYYLFDNWASTIIILKNLRSELGLVSDRIMAGLDPKKKEIPASQIIPNLNELGKQLRTSQHLYRGYENLIARILEFKEKHHGNQTPDDRLSVSLSACYRFERLRDHIKFLVLNYLDEAICEKEGLFTTYFNITTQKDSKATAKLSSSAAILSKLGVLFLPVSLMTGYFSIQIQELEGVYTVETYWVSFAVIMVLSFLCLFMFSSILVGVGSTIDRWMRRVLHVPG